MGRVWEKYTPSNQSMVRSSPPVWYSFHPKLGPLIITHHLRPIDPNALEAGNLSSGVALGAFTV